MTGDQLRNLDTEAFIEYAGVIHNSIVYAERFPLPPDVVDAMGECRREAFRRGIDLHPYMQKAQAQHVGRKALERQLRTIERRLETAQRARSNTRASATTKAARMGQLAQSRDAVVSALNLLTD